MKKRLRSLLLPLLLLACPGIAVADNGLLATPGGAAYRDLAVGSGGQAAYGDVATIHFVGWLDDNGRKGKQIFNSRRDGRAVSFVIGTDGVMQGWNEGVIGMRPGGKRLLKLPPALGYGQRAVEGVIPRNARLIFVIELLGLEQR